MDYDGGLKGMLKRSNEEPQQGASALTDAFATAGQAKPTARGERFPKPKTFKGGTQESKEELKSAFERHTGLFGLNYWLPMFFRKPVFKELDSTKPVYLVTHREDMRGFALTSKILASTFYGVKGVNILKVTKRLYQGNYGSMEDYLGDMPEQGEAENLVILGSRKDSIRVGLGSLVSDLEYELQAFPKGYSLEVVEFEDVEPSNMSDLMFMTESLSTFEILMCHGHDTRAMLLNEIFDKAGDTSPLGPYWGKPDLNGFMTALEGMPLEADLKQKLISAYFYNQVKNKLDELSSLTVDESTFKKHLSVEIIGVADIEKRLHQIATRGRTLNTNEKLPATGNIFAIDTMELPSPSGERFDLFDLAEDTIPNLLKYGIIETYYAYHHLPDEVESYHSSVIKAYMAFATAIDHYTIADKPRQDVITAIGCLNSIKETLPVNFNFPNLPLTEDNELSKPMQSQLTVKPIISTNPFD